MTTDTSPESEPAIELGNRALAAVLAWAIPGLGHYFQGRRVKAILFAAPIWTLMLVGLILGDFKILYWEWLSPFREPEDFRFAFLCQFFAGGPSILAFLQGTLEYRGLDPILGGLFAKPPVAALNNLQLARGRIVEIATIYTMVAGLLNILAIYDAFAGPAYGHAPHPHPPHDENAAAEAPPATIAAPAPSDTPAEVRA